MAAGDLAHDGQAQATARCPRPGRISPFERPHQTLEIRGRDARPMIANRQNHSGPLAMGARVEFDPALCIATVVKGIEDQIVQDAFK